MEKEYPFTVAGLIEERADDPETAHRVYLRDGARQFTFAQYAAQARRYAALILAVAKANPKAASGGNPHVAICAHNSAEFTFVFGGAALAGANLFAMNLGVRGAALRTVLNQSRATVLFADRETWAWIAPELPGLEFLHPGAIIAIDPDWVPGGGVGDLPGAFARYGIAGDARPPELEITPGDELMVIYSSGTTGLPKGVRNSHGKFRAIASYLTLLYRLERDDIMYVCMPLIHSNSWFIAMMPMLLQGGSVALRAKFSARAFAEDIFAYGATGWNYVGQPMHYIIAALEKQYGSPEAIEKAIAGNPRNRFKKAMGNGASPLDQDKFYRYFGLEQIYETYGSTEAATATRRLRDDPRGSVGEILDDAVRILRPDGKPCPPAVYDGEILMNYAEAVGEICHVGEESGFYHGYYENAAAEAKKREGGIFHSGDLGHVRIVDGRRYLYFDGRTEDWIRKDGENFSAENAVEFVRQCTGVALAAAYGVPNPIADEWVMTAITLAEGAAFDPGVMFADLDRLCREGGMDRKWFPDFIRVVDDFERTPSEKILVRLLKEQGYRLDKCPGARIWWRRHHDTAFRPFTPADFGQLQGEFRAAGLGHLIGV